MSVKSLAGRIGRALISRPVMVAIGAIAIALLVWFGGPLVAIAGREPLASPAARLWTLLALALWWCLLQLWHWWLKRRRQAAFAAALSVEEQALDAGTARELSLMRERLQQALAVLRGGKFGRGRSLYQLPWYLLVGPPGAGKTTLLHNSGLEFPLAGQFGPDAISGIGGTRHCDWWFTNKAVLIDTAGRYTTQDSNQRQDGAAWLGFLDLLRRHRPQCPLNGLLISMSMADLITQTKTERRLHARAIKQRIGEVQNQLGVRLPVYVILTKADLVAGFREYFADLGREEREQVWGVTLPLVAEDADKGVVAGFNREFHALVSRVYDRQFQRLQQEGDSDRRSRIYEFPKQLRLLQSAADDFLKEIFAPNAFEEASLLRGVYLASATQEGAPIDRVMQTVASGFGLNASRPAPGSDEGRGYFIRRLLDEVVFSEQALAGANRHHQAHNRWLLRTVSAATLATLAVAGWAWWHSYHWNLALVEAVAKATSSLAATEPDSSEQLQLLALANRLDELQQLPASHEPGAVAASLPGFGLDQEQRLQQAAKAAYERGLRQYLLPYLLSALEQEMANNSQYLDYLYETLKTYLMLADRERYQPEQVGAWFNLYLERQLPGDGNSAKREDLSAHVRALLGLRIRAEPVNQQAIANARSQLRTIPLADRAYQRLQQDYLHSHIPDFRLTDHLSAEAIRVFERASGAGLNQGIPGLYTYNGFHGIFLGENERLVKRLTADSWVYGNGDGELDGIDQQQIREQVLQRYLQDYLGYWDGFISDLQLRSFSDADNGAWLVKTLTGPNRPLQALLAVLRKNLQLSRPPLVDGAEQVLEVADKAGQVTNNARLNDRRIDQLRQLAPEDLPALPAAPGAEVEQAFAALLAVTDADLDRVLMLLQESGQQLERMANAGGDRRIAFQLQASDGSRQAQAELRRLQRELPEPLSSWVNGIADGTGNLTSSGASQHLNEVWQDSVLAEFERALAGRYPLQHDALQEATLKDFGDFFGYGGILDRFFSEYLAPHVNTRSSTWRLERNIGVSPHTLAMFQRAAAIRRLYFAPGSKVPQVQFGLRPLYLDQDVARLLVSIDGQELIYRHGPPKVSTFVWPRGDSVGQTRVVLAPLSGERSVNASYNGDWSLFRLLDQLTQDRPQTSDDRVLDIQIGGRRAKLELMPDSVNHPFWNQLLEGFTCPRRL
ncbi:MAG: type VI secretion system membrane subunit TssM [Gammaproteobacteria bacterium]|nr:type VI secretion system membrane subunit TssM [Gammaproteobacteria bacterium]